MTMSRAFLFSLVLILLFAITFWLRIGRRPPPTPAWQVPRCDSATAARVVLDSLEHTDGFRSAVYRFERGESRLRITTMPDQRSRPGILDGMALVVIGPRCSILSVVRTDSA
jgi:hypothetical protein